MSEILIVDDETNIRRMVGALLSAEGFMTREAANGASGVAAAGEHEPDAVLLDLMMPGRPPPGRPGGEGGGRAGRGRPQKGEKPGVFSFPKDPPPPGGGPPPPPL